MNRRTRPAAISVCLALFGLLFRRPEPRLAFESSGLLRYYPVVRGLGRGGVRLLSALRLVTRLLSAFILRPGTLRVVEDLVTADALPDDVRLARTDFRAVPEKGTSIRRPRHLEPAGNTLVGSHAKASTELPLHQIVYEPCDCSLERLLLFGSQRIEGTPKSRRTLVRWHYSACSSREAKNSSRE